MLLLGSIQPKKVATINNMNKNKDNPTRILRELNSLSEPVLPPFNNAIRAEPKLNKITDRQAITTYLIVK